MTIWKKKMMNDEKEKSHLGNFGNRDYHSFAFVVSTSLLSCMRLFFCYFPS